MIEKYITMAANLYYEEEKEVSGGLKKVLAIALIGIMLISDVSPASVKFVKAEEQIQMVEEPGVMELTAEELVSEEPVSEEPVSEEPVSEWKNRWWKNRWWKNRQKENRQKKNR